MAQAEKRGQGDTHVTAHVRVFRVPTSGDGLARGHGRVDTVDSPERIGVNLQVGQSLVTARLEGRDITQSSGIEGMDRGEDGVGVLARTASAGVSGDIAASGVPVRLCTL